MVLHRPLRLVGSWGLEVDPARSEREGARERQGVERAVVRKYMGKERQETVVCGAEGFHPCVGESLEHAWTRGFGDCWLTRLVAGESAKRMPRSNGQREGA